MSEECTYLHPLISPYYAHCFFKYGAYCSSPLLIKPSLVTRGTGGPSTGYTHLMHAWPFFLLPTVLLKNH